MKIENIKPGMTIWDVRSYTMGNTSIRTVGTWQVKVISVDSDRRTIVASWNGNAPKTLGFAQWSKFRAKRPELEAGPFGSLRLKRRNKDKLKVKP